MERVTKRGRANARRRGNAKHAKHVRPDTRVGSRLAFVRRVLARLCNPELVETEEAAEHLRRRQAGGGAAVFEEVENLSMAAENVEHGERREAHELCVHFGMMKGRRLGGLLAGLGFMLPGLVLILAIAWLYQRLDLQQPQIAAIFVAIQMGVVALIVRAVHRIADHTLTDPWLWAIAVASAPAWAAVCVAIAPVWVAAWTARARFRASTS